MNPTNSYNIRVYALIVENGNVLITDEFRMNTLITKFPGGGLEFGEGLIECIQRECIEELGQAVEVIKHFYTTDFFITSAFNEKQQLISIYYLAKTIEPLKIKISNTLFDFEKIDGAQSFRWQAIPTLAENDFTFTIDKKVAMLLKSEFA